MADYGVSIREARMKPADQEETIPVLLLLQTVDGVEAEQSRIVITNENARVLMRVLLAHFNDTRH